MGIISDALADFDSELPIVQELQDEKALAATSEFDALHEQIKNRIETDKEVELKGDETSGDDDLTPPEDTPSDDGSGTGSPDDNPDDSSSTDVSPKASEGDDEPEEVDDDGNSTSEKKDDQDEEPLKDNGVSTESIISGDLRQGSYYTRMALEGVAWDTAMDAASQGAGYAWHASAYFARGVYELSRYLGGVGLDLGREYGPKIMKGMKKGVAYLLTRSLKALLSTIANTAKFVERYHKSINRTQRDIVGLQKALAVLKGQADKPYSLRRQENNNGKLITWLSVKTQSDVRKSAQTMEKFLNEIIGNVDRGITHDLEVVKRLIDLSSSGTRGNLLGYLDVLPLHGGFLRKNVKGYVGNPQLADSLVYGDELPNKVLFVANLPKPHLKTIEEISEAYQASGLFLATNTEVHAMPTSMQYLDLDAFEAYLKQLSELCLLATQRMGLYARIEKQCTSLKLGYKHYAETLLASEEQKTVQDSLAEFIQLKQNFVNKSYLPAAMDVHDFVATYLLYAVRFAKANLKAFEHQ